MSNRQSTQLQTAKQRWTASGLEKPALLKERLTMLSELIKRTDLTATEIRVCYYLIVDRMNAETGLCAVSDRNIADALSINIRTVERAKEALKAKGILAWETQRFGKRNSVSLYKVQLQGSSGPQTGNCYDSQTGNNTKRTTDRPGHNPGLLTGINSDSQTGTEPGLKHYAKEGSPELAAWDRWSQITRGKSLPRDKRNGWHVPSKNPPMRELTTAEFWDL